MSKLSGYAYHVTSGVGASSFLNVVTGFGIFACATPLHYLFKFACGNENAAVAISGTAIVASGAALVMNLLTVDASSTILGKTEKNSGNIPPEKGKACHALAGAFWAAASLAISATAGYYRYEAVDRNDQSIETEKPSYSSELMALDRKNFIFSPSKG